MRHFDIIYIHKWNYGGCCCWLHWRDVKNSWQTKTKVDRCATYLNLNVGLWTSGGPVSIINNRKKAFLWCLFVHLARFNALDCKTRRLCVRVCLSPHPTCHRAAYWVENQDWDERWKEKEYEMQKGPFCTSVLSAFSTVLHLRPEWSQWELSLVIQPPGTQPYFNFLVTTGPDIVCIVTKEVSSVTIACSIFDITTILKQVDILGRILGISPSECAQQYISPEKT